MTVKKYVGMAVFAVFVLLAVKVFVNLQRERDVAKQRIEALQVQISALDQAHEANAQALQVQLQALQEKKQAVKTAAQAQKALPSVVPIQVPLDLPDAPSYVEIRRDDLKPLYDFGVGCEICAVKLAAAQADNAGLQAKIGLLEEQKKAALTAGRPSFFKRLGKASKIVACAGAGGFVGAAIKGPVGGAAGGFGGALVCSLF